jgi:DNA-directed RNA polymerase
VKRKVKEDERRARVRAAIGEAIDGPVMEDAALLAAESDIMGSPEEEVVEPESEGLTEDEVEDMERMMEKAEGKKIPEERVGTQRFVRFADILPPTPPRGAFDVQRIKDSAYFFS